MFAWVNRVEDDVEGEVGTVVVKPRFHESLEVGMCVNMKGLEPVHHAECADESDESEAVVSMEVRNEDVIEPGRAQSQATQCYLRPFAAVNEESLVT